VVTIPVRNAPDRQIVIPEASWAQASGGGTWVTQIQITSFSAAADISVYFDYQGGTRGPIALTTGLGQNRSVSYANILSTLQTLEGGAFTYYGKAGALRFQTQSDDKGIHVQARLRNGNYGKTTQGQSRHDSNVVRFSPTLQRGVIQGLTSNEPFRTFTGFYNGSADAITIEFRVVNSADQTVGSIFSKTIPGWGFIVFNPFVEAGRPYPTYSNSNCWLWISPTSGNGQAMGFGSLTNNRTNDTYELVMVQFQ